MGQRVMRQYALYRGDEFVDLGTADELASRRGCKASSIKFMASPAYHRRHGYESVKAYKIPEDDHAADDHIRH